MKTTLLLIFAALLGLIVPPCAVAEESPWVENMGEFPVDNGETCGMLDFLESFAAQEVPFSLQQDGDGLILSADRQGFSMTVKAGKMQICGEDNTMPYNMELSAKSPQSAIADVHGYADFFPLKEEDRVDDDFYGIVTGWVESHVSSNAPHVLIEFSSPDGGLIYVFFESAEDGESAKIRKIFYVSLEDLEYS